MKCTELTKDQLKELARIRMKYDGPDDRSMKVVNILKDLVRDFSWEFFISIFFLQYPNYSKEPASIEIEDFCVYNKEKMFIGFVIETEKHQDLIHIGIGKEVKMYPEEFLYLQKLGVDLQEPI